MYVTKFFRYYSRRHIPPGACDLITINHIITSNDYTIKEHSHTGVMLLGDFNNLNDTQLRSYPLKQVVRLPTRRPAILDKILPTLTTCTIRQKSLPSSFSDHDILVYEPVTSFRFNAGATIDIDIHLSNPKAKGNFSNA